MEEIFEETFKKLENAITSCKSNTIALSGGLDSAIISYFLKERKPKAITIIAKDFLGTDLTYSQIISNKFGLELKLKHTSTEEIMDAIEETIKILKNFNDIEIRNTIVNYLTFKELKKSGESSIINGDGADELFAGYQFLLTKSEDELTQELSRIQRIMHFPAQKIAEKLGITIESPFLSKEIIELANNMPIKYKVNIHDDITYGKWILRKIFEEKIPKSIVWRQKSPMQDGSGTAGLTDFFESTIPDSYFEEKRKNIEQQDNIMIRSKESLYYYQIFKKNFKVTSSTHSKNCPYCRHVIEKDSKFCRMCGAYPI